MHAYMQPYSIRYIYTMKLHNSHQFTHKNNTIAAILHGLYIYIKGRSRRGVKPCVHDIVCVCMCVEVKIDNMKPYLR